MNTSNLALAISQAARANALYKQAGIGSFLPTFSTEMRPLYKYLAYIGLPALTVGGVGAYAAGVPQAILNKIYGLKGPEGADWKRNYKVEKLIQESQPKDKGLLGAIPPALLWAGAPGLVGAGIGATMGQDRKEKIRNALIGLALGAGAGLGAMYAAPYLGLK